MGVLLSSGYSCIFKLILLLCVQRGCTALIEVLGDSCNTIIARLLIDKGANLDIQDKVSLTIGLLSSFTYSCIFKLIIILCAQVGDTALMQALLNDDNEIARLLIDKGANLDIQDEVS